MERNVLFSMRCRTEKLDERQKALEVLAKMKALEKKKAKKLKTIRIDARTVVATSRIEEVKAALCVEKKIDNKSRKLNRKEKQTQKDLAVILKVFDREEMMQSDLINNIQNKFNLSINGCKALLGRLKNQGYLERENPKHPYRKTSLIPKT